jgi:shikimate dehydrogenase
MKKFGLVGFPLSHSFSKKYFTEKFQELGIAETHQYDLYEIEDINELKNIIKSTEDLTGLNVTIPHKLNVKPLLNEIDSAAERIGAVNVIKVLENKTLKGYNSDYFGFRKSLENFLGNTKGIKALVLGNGGAARAVCVALEDMGIVYNGPGNRNHLIDPFNEYNGKIGIEYRGNYSLSLPQKPYSIELIDNLGVAIDSSIFGMPTENDWLK